MMPVQDLVTEVARVLYSEGQFLGATDFQAEQSYHRTALGRHQIGGHTWGVVAGLELVEIPDSSDAQFVDPVLRPGLAVDGYGRSIVNLTTATVDAALFAEFTGDGYHQVWLEYDETTEQTAPDGYFDCRDGVPTRTVETFRIVVDPPQPISPVIVDGTVADPPVIPDDRSVPYQEMPTEPPVLHWPVRLGSLHWDGTVGRFRPSAAGRLDENRQYAGAVAAQLLSPTTTLQIAPRIAPTDPDADEFATVDGRLRIKGRLSAEKDVWLEGGQVRFAYQAASEENTIIALGRDHGTGAQERLRMRLGDDANPDHFLSIGTQQGAGETTIAEVHADGRVAIPNGVLDLGTTDRQEIELRGSAAAIGTQPGTVFIRTPGELAFYCGGTFSDAMRDPGAGGLLQAVFDSNGSLDFGSQIRQMINLWSSSGQHQYGIGVQDWTLYFRTDADVCWFKRGSHVDTRGQPGGGGTLQMRLNEDASLDVIGGIHSFGDVTADGSLTVHGPSLTADGSLLVRGGGPDAVSSVIRVQQVPMTLPNMGSAPVQWSCTFNQPFTEVPTVFASLTGFSVANQIGDATPQRFQDTSHIPQHVWVNVDGSTQIDAHGRAFCAQSDAAHDTNSEVQFVVVAMGRIYS
jgi:hypothetical protein